MRSPRLLTLMIAAAVTLAASSADAQYYRFGRRGVIVRAPGVGVVVGRGGVSVNTPYGAYGYGGPAVVYDPGYYHTPGVAVQAPGVAVGVSPTPVVVGETASPTPVVAAKPAAEYAMSEAQLAALSEKDLLAALANASAQLNAELGTLSGGEGWQRYLALPESAEAGSVESQKLTQLLARFDSVARDRQFRMIAGLNSFDQMRTTLRLAVDRFRGEAGPAISAPAAPAAQESLPRPTDKLIPAAEQEVGPTPAGPDPTKQAVLQL